MSKNKTFKKLVEDWNTRVLKEIAAAKESLSPKQAAYGWLMIRKYHGQLGTAMLEAAGHKLAD